MGEVAEGAIHRTRFLVGPGADQMIQRGSNSVGSGLAGIQAGTPAEKPQYRSIQGDTLLVRQLSDVLRKVIVKAANR